MTSIPPLLPQETLARVLRLARMDGMSVLVVAGLFALISALAGDVMGAIVGLLVAGAGSIELHGGTLLEHGETRGVNWLVTSQLFLMVTVLAYCQLRLMHVDIAALRSAVTDDMKTQLATIGWSVDEFVRLVYRVTYFAVGSVTVLYQGGMALYYHRRRAALQRALGDTDTPRE